MNRRRITSAAAALAATTLAVTLAACSPQVKQVDDQSSGADQSGQQSGQAMSGATTGTPTLDQNRIDRIASDVQEVLDRAQSQNDPEVLKERLVGGALAMRTGQFTRAAKTGTDLDPLAIDVNVASATASESWPRVLLVGSAAAQDKPAVVFLFTQDSAQSDYMLQNWVRAVGGNSVQGVAVEDGTKALAPDAKGFRMTPQQALETYINFLNSPDNAEYQVFDDNTFAPRYREDLTKLNDAVAAAGNVTATAAVSADYPVTAVALATGEALVASSFTYTHTYQRTVAGSTMSVGGTPAAYMDNPSVVGKVTVQYLVNIFFTIPSAGSTDPVRIVGSERVITSVASDDSAKPEGE